MYMYIYMCVCICVYVYMYIGGQYFYRCIRTHGYVCRRKKYRTPRDRLRPFATLMRCPLCCKDTSILTLPNLPLGSNSFYISSPFWKNSSPPNRDQGSHIVKPCLREIKIHVWNYI